MPWKHLGDPSFQGVYFLPPAKPMLYKGVHNIEGDILDASSETFFHLLQTHKIT
ncbi:MAG: hypothetical protein MJA27_17610 [Pseudanabaenales cyanobacterium]|nr:hypothetical protein [Pseudanabaenales cyanobacterium]